MLFTIVTSLVILLDAEPKVSQLTKLEDSQSDNADKVIKYGYIIEGGSHKADIQGTNSYAGVRGKKITDIAIKAVGGSVSYRVHVIGGGWLPAVTGYSWSDNNNGYAGNHKPIDLIQVTSSLCVPQYRVSPVNKDYYSWQYGDETSNGQDGYAGSTGKAIDRFQIYCSNRTVPINPGTCTKDPNTYMHQRDSKYNAVVKEGCLYCCICYMAGFCTITQVDNAFDWACNNGWLRRSDSYVQTLDRVGFAKALNAKFGGSFRSGLTIQYSGTHFYVTKGGKEVYNSVYIGYH